MKVLKILNENEDVVYSYIKAPFFISDRDFCQKRVTFKNFKEIDFIMAFENYRSKEFGPKKGVIRASTVISGYIIRKKGNGT